MADALERWQHLKRDEARALLVNLRRAVEPILANNLLPHFTDHSVAHSDNVCGLVDLLVAPLQAGTKALSEDELVVIYSACYLHDVGMQYEAAGDTQVIQALKLLPPWSDLSVDTRRDLLRRCHHLISAEMVMASVRAERPPIGIQLTSEYHPANVAALCEAHVLGTDSQRYNTLMQGNPSIRMLLLSGVLRIADILDESRRRAKRAKAETLLLNVESQSHWWRHYYTEHVDFDETKRRITLWFDYPPDRHDEYSRVIPALQIPWINAEMGHHHAVFAEAGLIWSLGTAATKKPYSDTEAMPEAVYVEMLSQLSRQRQLEEERARQAALKSFKEARPLFQRRLKELQSKKDSLPADQYLLEVAEIAEDLWRIGSKRSAWMTLVSPFDSGYQQLDLRGQVRIGSRLIEMMIEDNSPDVRLGWLEDVAKAAEKLGAEEPLAGKFLSLVLDWYIRSCAYDRVPLAGEQAVRFAMTEQAKAVLRCKVNEAHFLQGEFGSIGTRGDSLC